MADDDDDSTFSYKAFRETLEQIDPELLSKTEANIRTHFQEKSPADASPGERPWADKFDAVCARLRAIRAEIRQRRKIPSEAQSVLALEPEAFLTVHCDVCEEATEPGGRFLSCALCFEPSTEMPRQLPKTFISCPRCFIVHNHHHDRSNFTELILTREVPIKSNSHDPAHQLVHEMLHGYDIHAELNAFNPQKSRFRRQPPSTAQGTYRAGVSAVPLSSVVRAFLSRVDLANHEHAELIKYFFDNLPSRSDTESPTNVDNSAQTDTSSTGAAPEGLGETSEVEDSKLSHLSHHRCMFEGLLLWSTACLLLADTPDTLSSEAITLKMYLRDEEWVSIRLLKEWWMSEIQDPPWMHNEIAYLVVCSLVPTDDNENFYQMLGEARHKHDYGYHVAMMKLFQREFLGEGPVETLFDLRREAAIESCVQRLGHASSNSSRKPSWLRYLPGFNSQDNARLAAELWKDALDLECAPMIDMLEASDDGKSDFWFYLDMVTHGTRELFKANEIQAGHLLGPPTFRSVYAPIPWVLKEQVALDYPRYLWDAADAKTIDTKCFYRLTPPPYYAVSHTWGRWRISQAPGASVAGVPWLVPRNTLWDVQTLPQILKQVPGSPRYIWLDLVCVPQRPHAEQRHIETERQEIGKQAAIFSKADKVIAWLSDMETLEPLRVLLLTGSIITRTKVQARGDPKPNLPDYNFKLSSWKASMLPLMRPDAPDEEIVYQSPEKYMHQWFTSLWTLQEVVMRPDMWLCNRDMKPLRLHETARGRDQDNISLDSVVALIDKLRTMDFFEQSFALASYDTKRTKSAADSVVPRLNDIFSDEWLKMTPAQRALRKFLAETPLHQPVQSYKRLPFAFHALVLILTSNGMLSLLRITPGQILTLADYRQCKSRRSEAIMSAFYLADWFRSYDPQEPLVLDRYPLSFLSALRERIGTSELLRPFMLPIRVPDLIEKFEATGQMPSAIGSMLPFGAHSSLIFASSTDSSSSLNVLKYEHSTVRKWQICLDGSIQMPHAAILHSSGDPPHECNCLKMKITEAGIVETEDGVEPGKSSMERTKDFIGTPYEWAQEKAGMLAGRKCATSHLVIVNTMQSLQRREAMMVTDEGSKPVLVVQYHSQGIVLRQLTKDTLVRTGIFNIYGCRRCVFPEPGREVNWRIL